MQPLLYKFPGRHTFRIITANPLFYQHSKNCTLNLINMPKNRNQNWHEEHRPKDKHPKVEFVDEDLTGDFFYMQDRHDEESELVMDGGKTSKKTYLEAMENAKAEELLKSLLGVGEQTEKSPSKKQQVKQEPPMNRSSTRHPNKYQSPNKRMLDNRWPETHRSEQLRLVKQQLKVQNDAHEVLKEQFRLAVHALTKEHSEKLGNFKQQLKDQKHAHDALKEQFYLAVDTSAKQNADELQLVKKQLKAQQRGFEALENQVKLAADTSAHQGVEILRLLGGVQVQLVDTNDRLKNVEDRVSNIARMVEQVKVQSNNTVDRVKKIEDNARNAMLRPPQSPADEAFRQSPQGRAIPPWERVAPLRSHHPPPWEPR